MFIEALNGFGLNMTALLTLPVLTFMNEEDLKSTLLLKLLLRATSNFQPFETVGRQVPAGRYAHTV